MTIPINMDDSLKTADVTKAVTDMKPEHNQTTIPADPYANVKRELSEEELNSPAVQKLLLNDAYRMEREIERLKEIEALYHSRDKTAAILEERLRLSTGAEILFTACETVGSLLAGLSTLYWDNKGWILLVVGVGLVLGGIVYKFLVR